MLTRDQKLAMLAQLVDPKAFRDAEAERRYYALNGGAPEVRSPWVKRALAAAYEAAERILPLWD